MQAFDYEDITVVASTDGTAATSNKKLGTRGIVKMVSVSRDGTAQAAAEYNSDLVSWIISSRGTSGSLNDVIATGWGYYSPFQSLSWSMDLPLIGTEWATLNVAGRSTTAGTYRLRVRGLRG